MNETRYLLDNNALGRITPAQRATLFVKEACRLPSEVLYEARGFPDIELLNQLEYPTTASVLTSAKRGTGGPWSSRRSDRRQEFH